VAQNRVLKKLTSLEAGVGRIAGAVVFAKGKLQFKKLEELCSQSYG
jgi:hypothetical protein